MFHDPGLNRKYCSNECAGNRANGLMVACVNCGKEIYRPKALLVTKRAYCSVACRTAGGQVQSSPATIARQRSPAPGRSTDQAGSIALRIARRPSACNIASRPTMAAGSVGYAAARPAKRHTSAATPAASSRTAIAISPRTTSRGVAPGQSSGYGWSSHEPRLRRELPATLQAPHGR